MASKGNGPRGRIEGRQGQPARRAERRIDALDRVPALAAERIPSAGPSAWSQTDTAGVHEVEAAAAQAFMG